MGKDVLWAQLQLSCFAAFFPADSSTSLGMTDAELGFLMEAFQ